MVKKYPFESCTLQSVMRIPLRPGVMHGGQHARRVSEARLNGDPGYSNYHKMFHDILEAKLNFLYTHVSSYFNFSQCPQYKIS